MRKSFYIYLFVYLFIYNSHYSRCNSIKFAKIFKEHIHDMTLSTSKQKMVKIVIDGVLSLVDGEIDDVLGWRKISQVRKSLYIYLFIYLFIYNSHYSRYNSIKYAKILKEHIHDMTLSTSKQKMVKLEKIYH